MHSVFANPTRRQFTAAITQGLGAAATLPLYGLASACSKAPAVPKRRLAIVGTGIRGSKCWGRDLLREHGDRVELVGLCDINSLRVAAGKRVIDTDAPVHTDLDAMLQAVRPDVLIVATRDSVHHEQIVQALRFGCDVITEKPMTTDEVKCRTILEAEKETGRSIAVAFNYRFGPTAERVKQLLMEGTIGAVTSVDFHWYLDTEHGADYFRRWHAYKRNSGTLFVHKATHHFDLVNWFLGTDPVVVTAMAELRKYGKNGPFRATNCRGCPHREACPFHWDIMKSDTLRSLYVDCESEDSYLRDACVYREDIDIWDTMTAQVRYDNGVLLSYSLNAFMPVEGYSLAINGMNGRIEVRSHEKQPWDPSRDEDVRLVRSARKSEVVEIEKVKGDHGGADPRMRRMLFEPERPDPLGQRAGSRAGALSILTGVAAARSVETGGPVRIADLA